jgi:predicted ATP-dependent serine protease
MSEELLDITKLNDATLSIQKAFNTKDSKYVENAINILSLMLKQEVPQITPIRADQIAIPETKGYISSGVEWLDLALGGGMRRQEELIIGGSPHAGKTHLLCYVSAQYVKQGLNVLHFNGEDILGDILDIYGCMLEEKHQEQVWFVDISDKFSVPTIEKAIETMEIKPDVIVVDHIDCMQVDGSQSDFLEVGKVATDLRLLGKRTNSFVLTGSQLNFAGMGQQGMSRFYRGKVAKGGPADLVWIIDEQVDGDVYITVSKAKGRKMKNRKVAIQMDFDTMQVRGM